MTTLRRVRPVRAPRVSNNAVGSISPTPSRPRLSRIRIGSTFHPMCLDIQPTTRVLTSRTYAR